MNEPHQPPAEGRPAPRRVVALGGGTGLPVVLRGLRRVVPGSGEGTITAIVTMSDDGGSSGRLRRSLGSPPPGDVRNCLVALAEEEDLLAGLFQHRYGGSDELGGHSVGNLILVALAEQTGSFLKAVEMSSRVLRTVGTILPATEAGVRLVATLSDGSKVVGETAIAGCGSGIERISLDPSTAKPTRGVLEAILGADLVVLGPGSLHTSVVPHLVVPQVAEALRETAAIVVLVANLVSERGEMPGLDVIEHLAIIEKHAEGPILDAVLLHEGPIAADVLERYRTEGAAPLRWPDREYRALPVFRRPLLAAGPKLRHDPEATATALIEVWAALSSGATRAVARSLSPDPRSATWSPASTGRSGLGGER